jgi:hypothetical protein
MSYSSRSTHVAVTALLVIAIAAIVVPTNAVAAADHLLISEVVMKDRPGVPSLGSEYIKIHNPTAGPLDLSDVYLTDAIFTGIGYWQMVQGGQAGGGGVNGDFNARFPAGTSLGAGETFVVSLAGSGTFSTSYPGQSPDFELFEDGASPDGVADMVEAFPGSIAFGLGSSGANSVPSDGWLSDSGESVVLYQWDGAADLVVDLDYVLWGSTNTYRVDKSGKSVDGPDADTTPTAYQSDTAVASQDGLAAHNFGQAFVRTDNEETGETASGGNGFGGDDETSEPMTATWNAVGTQTSTSTGTPPAPAPIIADVVAPNVSYGTVAYAVTATVTAFDAVSSVTLWYAVDGVTWNDVAATAAGDDWSAEIPGMGVGAEVIWYLEAAGSGGGEAVWPAHAPFYTQSYTVQQLPDPGDAPAHLLLSEVCIQGASHEFVEIHNPTDDAVSLNNYYLTDAVYNAQGYWLVPAGGLSQSTVGGGDFADFHARFPADLEIGAGETMTLALQGSEIFNTTWGLQPDIEMTEDGGSADGIPEMREIFPGSLLGNPDGTSATLTNTAEIVVLYYWDGLSDLVTDIDMFFWGSSESARVNRDGVTVGASTYMNDTPVASQDQFSVIHDIGGSFQRLDPGEGDEPILAGNGPGGHDETGENLNGTWQAAATATPGEYSTEAMVFTSAFTTPSRPNPESATDITGALASLVDVTSVTLHYAVGGAATNDVVCTDNGDGTWTGAVPQQALGAVVTYYLTALGAGGETAVWPEGAPTTVLEFTVEEQPEPEPNPPHLLLTEVCVMATPHEFVEIYNPTTEPVALDNYYMTDAVHYDQAYYMLPAGNPSQGTIGGGDFFDFHARFPAGMVIQPGEAMTISIAGSEAFAGAWSGSQPDLQLVGGGSVPEMRDVFPGSRLGSPTGDPATLTNGGEIVVLYHWDQVSDLTTDIDMFMWGDSGSARVDRQNVSINGTAYANDTPLAQQDQFGLAHEVGQSFQRIDAAEGTEPETGGNGTNDHDETGENLNATWKVSTGTPGSYSEYVETFAFDPPQPPADTPSTFSLTLVTREDLGDPTGLTFYYKVNGGSAESVMMTDDAGTWTCSVPAFAGGSDVSWWVSIAYVETEVFFPAAGEAAPNGFDVLELISLKVPAKTFLPAFEEFPMTVTFPTGSEAVLRILDMEGRVVITLFDSRFNLADAAINRMDFRWDGRNEFYELVKAGTYIVHLQVVDERTGTREERVAPAVVATRLSR